MISKLSFVHLLLGPGHQSLFCDLIDEFVVESCRVAESNFNWALALGRALLIGCHAMRSAEGEGDWIALVSRFQRPERWGIAVKTLKPVWVFTAALAERGPRGGIGRRARFRFSLLAFS